MLKMALCRRLTLTPESNDTGSLAWLFPIILSLYSQARRSVLNKGEFALNCSDHMAAYIQEQGEILK